MTSDKTVIVTNPLFWLSGTSLFDQEKYGEAIRKFEKLPKNAKSLYNVGICQLNVGDYSGAIQSFKSSIEEDKYLSISYFQLGYAYHKFCDFYQASKNYEAALMFLGETEEIRYNDIGLKAFLLRCEVLFNLSLCLRIVGEKDASARAITQARSCNKIQNRDPEYLESCLGKLENGWVKNLEPFQVNMKSLFRAPFSSPAPIAVSLSSSISSFGSSSQYSISQYSNPRKGIRLNSNVTTSTPPKRAPPVPPRSPIQLGQGDYKLRSKSEPSVGEFINEVKPRSTSEANINVKYQTNTPYSEKELKKLEKEERKRKEKEEKRKSKEEKKRSSKEKSPPKNPALNGLTMRINHIESKVDRMKLSTISEYPTAPSSPSTMSYASSSNYNIGRKVLSQDRAEREFKSQYYNIPPKTNVDTQWEINFQEIHLGNEIGRGAFGRVYQGTWRNAPCCVKVANPETSQESVLEFLKEAESMKKMRSHPNVCQLFGVCVTPTVSIVMELLQEGSLFAILHNPKVELDLGAVISMLKDICSGMSHLHAEGILHLDLAARNLLVKSDLVGNTVKYTIKISDFGMSSCVATSGEIYDVSSRSKFPVRWCAPEISSHRQVTKASDVWSYGVVAWEIIERKFPYSDLNNQEVIDLVFHQGYRLPKPTKLNYPNEIYQLMLRCWQMDPNRRPTFSQIYEELLVIERKIIRMNSMDNPSEFDIKDPRTNYGPIWNSIPSNSSSPSTTSSLLSSQNSSSGFSSPSSSFISNPKSPPSRILSPDYLNINNMQSPSNSTSLFQSQSINSPSVTKRFCSSCGNPIKPGDVFCSYCGNKL